VGEFFRSGRNVAALNIRKAASWSAGSLAQDVPASLPNIAGDRHRHHEESI
jgi:hypothetical protein